MHGCFLNPGNDNFTLTLRAPIYVDETDMLRVLNGFYRSGEFLCMRFQTKAFWKDHSRKYDLRLLFQRV